MNKEKLETFIKNELNIPFDDALFSKFSKYESLLIEWNNKFNLTAIRDEEGILEKHFIDSMCSMKYIDFAGKSLCDIGSGAGFPGMVLAIANPSSRVTLIESNGKKISFLNEVKNSLGLDNVEIINVRAEESSLNEAFDYVSARAVTKLNVLCELTIPMLKIHGKLIAYKLFEDEEEIKEAAHAIKELSSEITANEKYELPYSKDKRSLVIIEKIDKTKKKYPRSYGEICKSPL